MTPEKPAPISRRERPAKPALTRQGIIDAALAILRDEGLGKVTMRRIAAALDTGPASLYVYVRNTGDLHAQILDSLLGPVKAPAPEAGTWRDRLKALLVGYGEVLFRHPEIARMAMSTQPSGPNYLALVDAILGLLDEGGVSGREAAWAMDLLLLYPTAVAVEHSSPKSATQESDEFSALAAKIATADPARHPHIARLGDTLVSGDGPSRTDWALDVILDGVLAAASRASAEQRGW
ncbi:TetR family transcriptional regulator [Streptomyces mirabilis]|jgi:AcrR family transcriptional regulator|uniref:TetR/AcrR family transcriptional regulator n=1 Tax=Streptomyces mirabilis TaxID=68239 RepID=UPI00167CBAFE|nr:TetR/AcrR family transcriptional regulator [Streptomyces mirabilis]GHD45421.1 TetR family transcriptional regulator [Streptomyces mirabilis]